jgi:hypothetical protein
MSKNSRTNYLMPSQGKGAIESSATYETGTRLLKRQTWLGAHLAGIIHMEALAGRMTNNSEE